MIPHAQYIAEHPLPAMIVDFRALIANLIASAAAYESDRKAAAKAKSERLSPLQRGNDHNHAKREQNTSKVIKLLKSDGPLSQKDIAIACKISRGTISSHLTHMLGNGKIKNVGTRARPLWVAA